MTRILLNHPDAARLARAHAAASRFTAAAADTAAALLARCPVFQPTPLVGLPDLATRLDVAAVDIKDERARLNLGSFKALGGAYAVLTLAAEAATRQAGTPVGPGDLLAAANRPRLDLTFAAATAGNHGRSVAAGAALIGARCVIFVYDGVPAGQIAAIAGHGAEIRTITGRYDDALAACRDSVAREGWTLVPDTVAGPDDGPDIPARVMEGYTVLIAEALGQRRQPPTHLLLQAGVGGLAAAAAGYLANRLGPDAPAILVVEPTAAACLMASAEARRPITIPATTRTLMGRLECYAPSRLAWPILDGLAAAYIRIGDADAVDTARYLATRDLATSPSGAAGLAGLIQLRNRPRDWNALGLTPASRVLAIVTEAVPAAIPATATATGIQAANQNGLPAPCRRES